MLRHPGIDRREGESPNPGTPQADDESFILQQARDRLTAFPFGEFGSTISMLSEVLNGNRRLSLNMIRKLRTGLDISTDVPIRESARKAANA